MDREQAINHQEPEINWLEKNQHIVVGLRDVTSVMKSKDYRVIGSLVPLSLEDPYRKAGDIDLLAVAGKRDRASRLTSLGYSAEQVKGFGNIIGVQPTRFTKGETEIDMFFGDMDQKGGWRFPLKGGFYGYVPPAAWKGTTLEFGGTNFSSISPAAAQHIISRVESSRGIKYKSRAQDLEVLERHSDPKELAAIQEERPGLYYGDVYIPIQQVLIPLGNLALILEGHRK